MTPPPARAAAAPPRGGVPCNEPDRRTRGATVYPAHAVGDDREALSLSKGDQRARPLGAVAQRGHIPRPPQAVGGLGATQCGGDVPPGRCRHHRERSRCLAAAVAFTLNAQHHREPQRSGGAPSAPRGLPLRTRRVRCVVRQLMMKRRRPTRSHSKQRFTGGAPSPLKDAHLLYEHLQIVTRLQPTPQSRAKRSEPIGMFVCLLLASGLNPTSPLQEQLCRAVRRQEGPSR